MYFENFTALMMMDGHGPYVWAAYGITTVVMVSLVLSPLLRKRQLLAQLRIGLRREQAYSENQ